MIEAIKLLDEAKEKLARLSFHRIRIPCKR